MPPTVTARPTPSDYAPYYARYIDRLPAGDLVALMRAQIDQLDGLLRPLTEPQAAFAYAPGKWTIKEVVGHLIDTERVFAYRATAFSRSDPAPLPGFEQDDWIPFGEYPERSLPDLLDEWIAARRATIALAAGMPEAGLARRGMASNLEFSVLALLAIPPGHLIHHLDVLAERYHIGTQQP
jgi:uncharacterized protein (DUF3820 family)